jgi:hypothetical protein
MHSVRHRASSLINYGQRYRTGDRTSSCLAESTVNAVISKRFAKRQQMQWTKRGAHLSLQTRTRALDGTLRSQFERWYPGLANDIAPGPCSARCGLKTPHTSSCSPVGSVGIARSRRAVLQDPCGGGPTQSQCPFALFVDLGGPVPDFGASPRRVVLYVA